MMRLLLLCMICWQWVQAAEEQNVSAEQQKKADALAQAYMQELKQKRAQLGDAERTDIQALDLLVRKAEAYVLVEQPIDAGRMMSAAHEIIKKYQADQREQMQALLKEYSKRLSQVAQVVLKHTAQIDLDDDKATPKPAPAEQAVVQPKQQNDQTSEPDDQTPALDQKSDSAK